MSPRQNVATLLVVVPLAAALVPLAVPPLLWPLLAARIALAALGPPLAVVSLLFGVIAVAVARRARPLFALGALVAAALAMVPSIAARRAATETLGTSSLSPTGANAVISPFVTPRAPAHLVERAVRYSAADGAPLVGRLFRDTARCAAACPAVVVVYGGAWQRGDATQFAAMNRWVAGLGYTVVALDYRHAPAAPHPAQLRDLRRGLALLADSSAAWGVDASRVVLWGRSAGGHLATLTAWHPSDEPLGVGVRGVISFYGPFDLVRGYTEVPRPDPIDARAVLRAFTGGVPHAIPAVYRDASPSTFVRPGLPPTLLVYGGGDHVVKPEFGRAAAAALRRAGNEVVHVELPFAEHGFDYAEGGGQARAALGAAAVFLARVTR